MSKLMPLIVGGVIPALLYGAASVFQKLSAREGGSATSYLIYFGAATALSGLFWRAILKESWGTPRSAGLALVAGVVFSYHLNSSGKETRFFRKTWFLIFQTPSY